MKKELNLFRVTKSDKCLAAHASINGGSYKKTVRLLGEANAAREEFRRKRGPKVSDAAAAED